MENRLDELLNGKEELDRARKELMNTVETEMERYEPTFFFTFFKIIISKYFHDGFTDEQINLAHSIFLQTSTREGRITRERKETVERRENE